MMLLFWLFLFETANGISSPISPVLSYKHWTALQVGVADLWWSVDDAEREIRFEMHVKTTGWIALGISPAGGMTGADIGVGWVDKNATVHFQDRYAAGFTKPLLDNTTIDWFADHGREEQGWTAIQFRRLLDTCDPMDVPIKSGTNIIIFAYGLVDPDQMNEDISHHQDRRGTRMIPLRSYDNPPSENQFDGLDSFEFRLNNYLLPSADTTYHCKVFKIPARFTTIQHAIAYKVLVDPTSKDIVHHMTTYECDSSATFDDANLPEGTCDDITTQTAKCTSNMANGWAVGGDHMVEYSQEAGYPIGADFSVQYYMIQIHFDNREQASDRRDSSGVRFYIGKQRRAHDLGYLTLGVDSNPGAVAIPPQVEQFTIDGFCPRKATEKFPEAGITIVSAFPHTHLQGTSVWSKIIRSNESAKYLFNAESFNFNYQFQNHLPKPIKLFRGDAFITRCVYNTMNKKEITLGGRKTTDEMCLHTFAYYPRMTDLYVCVSTLAPAAWQTVANDSSLASIGAFKAWLHSISWTRESIAKWQEFFSRSSRLTYIIGGPHFDSVPTDNIATYQDVPPELCTKEQSQINSTSATITNSAIHRRMNIIFLGNIILVLMIEARLFSSL